MKELAHKSLKKIRMIFQLYMSVNWHKTIYFNFKMLPLKTALKLPVIFHGKVKFSGLSGRVEINTPIKFGLVEFGQNLEIIRRDFNKAELRVDGIFCINGSFSTGNDYVICIMPKAYLEIGDGSYLGSQTKIIATKSIKIGKGFRFGYESQISDSNYHYTIDIDLNHVSRFNKEVLIGDYCWIGNRTSIMKGTTTPKNLIVASNSLLNKDYTQSIPEKSVIGGVPAKLLRKNMVRVFDVKLENEIINYFRNNPLEEYFPINRKH